MTTHTFLHRAQYRIAQHYLNTLQQAESATRRGQQIRSHWLDQIQHDWAQIKQCQSWSASWTEAEPDKAQLCLAFPLATSSILRIRQAPSESLVWMQQGLQAAQKLKDHQAERTLLFLISLMYANLEMFDSAEAHAQQLLEQAQMQHDDLGLGCASLIMARVLEFRGERDHAESLFLKSIALLESCGADGELGSAWQGLGRIALARGDYELSYEYHMKLLDHVVSLGMEGKIAIAHLSLSGILIYLHDYRAAEAHAQQAVDIGQRIGFTRFIPAALLSLAHAQKWLGKLESACLHYEEALTDRSMLAPSTLVNALHGFGQARYRQGDLHHADSLLGQALELARAQQITFRLCEVLPDAIIVQLARDEMDKAQICLGELVQTAVHLGTPPYMAKALGTAVLLWRRLGHVEQAARGVGTLSEYSQYLDPVWFNASLFEALENTLGKERYLQAWEQGKAVTLKAALTTITWVAE